MKGDPWGIFFRETKSNNVKKTEGGTLCIFSTSILSPNVKKIEGKNLRKKVSRKKVSQCQKKPERDPLVSPGTVCYAEKQEKPFWVSSLGQMVQFDTIEFRRTFAEDFWSVRKD